MPYFLIFFSGHCIKMKLEHLQQYQVAYNIQTEDNFMLVRTYKKLTVLLIQKQSNKLPTTICTVPFFYHFMIVLTYSGSRCFISYVLYRRRERMFKFKRTVARFRNSGALLIHIKEKKKWSFNFLGYYN